MLTFTMDCRTYRPTSMTHAQRADLVTEVYARLCARVQERRWKKALGNLWRLLCLWSA